MTIFFIISPHLLSNSIVIVIVLLLVSFPFVEAILHKLDEEKEDIGVKTLGKLSITFGMINVSFSVFYGYLLPEVAVLVLTIPILGFLFLKGSTRYVIRRVGYYMVGWRQGE